MTRFGNNSEQNPSAVDLSDLLASPFQETPLEELSGILADPSSELTSPYNSRQSIGAAIETAFEHSSLSAVQLWERSSRLSELQGLDPISLDQVTQVLGGVIDPTDTHPWYTIAQVLGADVGGL